MEATGGVAGVDDAEGAGDAVLPSGSQGAPQLADVQAPAALLVQEVPDLHRLQLRQGGRVQGVLRDGDHHPGARLALAAHQQLQHRLGDGGKGAG